MLQDLVALLIAVSLRIVLPLALLVGVLALAIVLARRRWRAGYRGGDLVRAGLYWSPETMEFVQVPERVGILPGEPAHHFVPLPAALAVVAAPLVGLLYIVLLPGIVVVFCATLLVRGVANLVRRWRPARSAIERL